MFKFDKVPEVLVDVRITSNSITLAQNEVLMRNFMQIKNEEITTLINHKPHIYVRRTGQGGREVAKLLNEKMLKLVAF